MTWDDPHNHDRRQEVRRGGINEEELPHKKSAKKVRKRVDHKHDYVADVEDYWGWFYVTVKCSMCNKYNHKRSVYESKMWRKNMTDTG